MNKIIHFGNESRLQLKKGIDIVADAVKITLGARGRNVVITGYGARPHVTKDGVTVARNIFLNDPVQNMGASMVKEAARKTVDIAGDGTTTACVLVQSMVASGLDAINKAGSPFNFFSKDDTDKSINPVEIKEGIDFAVKAISDYLKQQAVPVKDFEAVKNIATISANNDTFIGNMIHEAYEKVGMEGLVTIEEAKSNETTLEVTEGLLINRGFISSSFVNNMSKMKSELIDPCILITDTTIRSFNDILTTVQYCGQQNKALVIIAEDVQGDALTTLVLNMQKRSFISCIIKAPAYGEERKLILEDIAIATGAKVVRTDAGKLLRKIIPSDHLGSAGKIITDKDSCIIVKGNGDEKKIEDHKQQLKDNMAATANGLEKNNIERRLANLGNGVAIIKVGGITETEMKERKDRIEDALLATRAAIEEGYVVGGGVALCKASLLKIKHDSPNVQTGINIVLKAIREPFRQILLNGGINPDDVQISLDNNIGYNIKTNKREDLMKSGVIDPVKVTRVALESAASIGGIFLTTECVIAEPLLPQDKI